MKWILDLKETAIQKTSPVTGSVIEEMVGQIVVRLARRHSTSDKIITFVWPDQEDVVIVDCDLDESVRNLPNPISSRRGLSFHYEEKLFDKLPSGYIQQTNSEGRYTQQICSDCSCNFQHRYESCRNLQFCVFIHCRQFLYVLDRDIYQLAF